MEPEEVHLGVKVPLAELRERDRLEGNHVRERGASPAGEAGSEPQLVEAILCDMRGLLENHGSRLSAPVGSGEALVQWRPVDWDGWAERSGGNQVQSPLTCGQQT